MRSVTFANEPEFNVQFKEAIAFFRQKVSLPTKTWRDIEGRAHDRAFVVAGAMKEELLSDLRGEIAKAIAGETTLQDFRKEFDHIVAKHGWTGWTGEDTAAGRAWRTRVIFETNLSTAYAAGRYAQMTDKDVVKVYAYWQYRHAFYRQPHRSRPEHLGWSGLTLKWDDPWWETHYPPNGWKCSCGIEVMSAREMKEEGIEPSEAPPITYRTVLDPRTNDKVKVPHGIDFGWDHAPGRDWSMGLVPHELQQPAPPSGAATITRLLLPLSDIAKPFTAKPLPEGTTPEQAVDAFLSAFGASSDNPVMYRDAAGHAIPIADTLFRTKEGYLKADKQGRSLEMPMLAETIKDPDEIWVDWAKQRDGSGWKLVRRYLRIAKDGLGFGSFTWSRSEWEGSTVFTPKKGDAGKPNPNYIERQRTGVLLYRRPAK